MSTAFGAVAPSASWTYPRQVPARSVIETAFVAQRGRLWGLCYRMSGCAADADDWLQDVFERALERPPANLEQDVTPWLTRVSLNVCRDHLRRRKHRAYAGPWLPGPIETSELWAALGDENPSAEARYGQLESVSLAFLHALEALTPNQRAVLILRDVLDCSVEETAELLELSPGSVKTTHHRARAALSSYEARRTLNTPVRQGAERRALEAFLVHLATHNLDALKELVAEDVVALNDGAGQYVAAQRPVRGRDKVLLFHRKVMRPARRVYTTSLNGTPAMIFETMPRKPREPKYVAVWVELDREERIAGIYAAIADRKVSRLPWRKAGFVTPSLALSMLRSACTAPPLQRWLPGSLRRAWRASPFGQ